MYLKLLFLICILYSLENGKTNTIEIQNSNAQNLTVFQRGLCDKKATKYDILSNHNSYYSHNNDSKVMKQILGFVEIVSNPNYI